MIMRIFHNFTIGWIISNLLYLFAFLWVFLLLVVASNTFLHHVEYLNAERVLRNITSYFYYEWPDFSFCYSVIFALLWVVVFIYID